MAVCPAWFCSLGRAPFSSRRCIHGASIYRGVTCGVVQWCVACMVPRPNICAGLDQHADFGQRFPQRKDGAVQRGFLAMCASVRVGASIQQALDLVVAFHAVGVGV